MQAIKGQTWAERLNIDHLHKFIYDSSIYSLVSICIFFCKFGVDSVFK